MKILYATSEMTPFVKTGGLADVAGALPKALAALGHDVAVALPFYSQIDREAAGATLVLPDVVVDLPAGPRSLSIWRAEAPVEGPGDGAVTVYLIEDRGLFTRPQLYADKGREYSDNPLRFAYFCMAAIWMLKGLGWIPDIIHCNDWQTAMIPTFLCHHDAMKSDPELQRIRVLFSIHNMSYQGIYPEYILRLLGLPRRLGQAGEMEFYGSINYLKGGILYSHAITTVSPQYAREIQTVEYGCGLEGVLREHSGRLSGILNGIDARVWDPAADPALPAHFSREDRAGKAECKRALQRRFKLPEREGTPVIGIISRMVPQKGFDLIVQAMPELMAEDVQFVLLGTGMPEYQRFFEQEARLYPEKIGAEIGFSDELAHQIEAGSDIFLMPSRFEPCGLNQLYSLRYGSIPIVRHTGGLADSIVDANPSTIVWGKGTGFVFGPYDMRAMMGAIRRALKLFREDKELWAKLMDNAMAQDFSWAQSAREYEKLMAHMIRRV